MVTVYVENGKFIVKGTFDLGYMGLYKDGQIGVDCDCSGIRDEWDSIYEMSQNGNCTDEDIAEVLTKKFNEAEEKIQQHIRLINNEFLFRIYDDMEGCGNEFWEHEELTVPGFDYKDPDFDFYSLPLRSKGYTPYGVGKPNDGSVEKDDFEASLREAAPMFNLDAFIKGIKPESLVLAEDDISFQCSDIYNWALICGAYDRINLEDLSFTDWHNY